MSGPSLWATKSWPSAVSVDVSANATLARLSPGTPIGPKTSASSPTSAPPTAVPSLEPAQVHDAVGRAVHHALLARRPAAGDQRGLDRDAVVALPHRARAARCRRRPAVRPSGRRRRRSRASARPGRPEPGRRTGRPRAGRRGTTTFGGTTSSKAFEQSHRPNGAPPRGLLDEEPTFRHGVTSPCAGARAPPPNAGLWSSTPMSGASGAPACRSSSRAGTRAGTSSPARCRCSRSCSSARCSARSTATGRCGRTSPPGSAGWRSCSRASGC